MTDSIFAPLFRGTDMDRLEYFRTNHQRDDDECYITDGIDTIVMRTSGKNEAKIPGVIEGVQIKTLGSTACTYSGITSAVISEGIEVIR